MEAGETPAAWRQAFLLPENSALKQSASLVVPPGTFKLDRSVEVMVDQQVRVLKLFRVLDRGAEFERCDFQD
jgi:hypothetical protein